MIRRPPRSTRTATLFPYTTLFRSVEHRDHRNAKRVGFLDRQLFLVDVDDEHHVGQAAHVADAAQRRLELVALARHLKDFLLREAVRVALKRSEERLVGKECVSTCRSRWSPYH